MATHKVAILYTVNMTIAIDARIIATTTGRYVERLIHYLEKLDTENDYLILVRKRELDYYKPTNPRFTIIEADFPDYSFDEQLGLKKLLDKLQPDLVHFCMPQQPVLYKGATVTTVHDLNLLRITSNDDMNPIELRIKKQIFRALLKRVAKKSRHIVTPSEYTKQDLVRFSGISPEDVTVTLEGADTVEATPFPVAELEDTPFIMYVGRAEPYKNNRRLIQAHQQLLEKHPNLRLAIVGVKDILRQEDMKWAKNKNCKNVDFLGFVSDAQLAWLYKNTKAYVFPSEMEGFGLPGLEAMSYGAPVASSNTTSLPEIYKDGAHYFDPFSVDDMANAINDVMTNASLRKKIIANGKKIHASYSWERMAKQTLAVYKAALK